MEQEWVSEPVEGASGIFSLIATPERVVGICEYRDGTIFSVDPEDGTIQATEDIYHGEQYHLGKDGRYYGVVRGPEPEGGGGVVQIDPESLTLTRYQGEDIYANIGESILLEDTLFYIDPDTWHLHSVPAGMDGQN
jgi:hypothetical protein